MMINVDVVHDGRLYTFLKESTKDFDKKNAVLLNFLFIKESWKKGFWDHLE